MKDVPVNDPDCLFCKIAREVLPAAVVYRDPDFIAFLDHRPLFPGHVLLCPMQHYETLTDLPQELLGPMMRVTQMLAGGVQTALEAEGSFIAVNNKISQSVPHLHIHVVPRRKRDGLKGFFWPRHKYGSVEERETIRKVLENSIRAV